MRPHGRPCPRGRWAASARTHPSVHTDALVSARMDLVLSLVTSKRTLQCVQVTDAPAAIVRSSIRPSVQKRPRDNHALKYPLKMEEGCH
jgi:hypothetical protein